MEKVAVANIPKTKTQSATSETFQKTEKQTQLTEFDLVFKPANTWFHDGGRAIDLSQIPVSAETIDQNKIVENKERELRDLLHTGVPVPDKLEENNETSANTINDEVETEIRSENPTTNVIADDSENELSEGQMRKTEFLQKLRTAICKTIGPTLATVGQTTEGCPYLNYWLDLYHEKDAAHIEQTARKYAPDIVSATTVEEYISIIAQRALRAAEIWARTGKLNGVPEGVPTTLPGITSKENTLAENPVQAKAKNGGVKRPDDPHAIKIKLGEGQPLSTGLRSRMEPAFGISFSHVRTHTDSTASDLSTEVNARAFTVGNHIAFGNGEYQPATLLGNALIAHELAHTIQQKGEEQPNAKSEIGRNECDTLEKDANQATVGVMYSLWKRDKDPSNKISRITFPNLRSGLRIQRCSRDKTKAATTIKAIPQAPSSALLDKMGLHGAPSSANHLKLPFGGYLEFIKWETDGRNGIIVQEINSTQHLTSGSGTSIRGESRPDPKYWEIWTVAGDGKASPDFDQVNDAWVRASHRGTSGNLAIDAKVFWVEALDIAAGFRSYNPNVPTVPNLKTPDKQPNNLGNSLLDSHATGTWDCTGNHT